MGYYGNWGAGYGFMGVIFMIVFWIIIICIVIALIRALTMPGRGYWRHYGHRHGRGHCPYCDEEGEKDALRILDERYAKGEINKEEYEQKKKDIMGK